VHVSDNDGFGHQDHVTLREPWWFSLLPPVNAGAVSFSEGNHRQRDGQGLTTPVGVSL
jgi:hypothetical protein